MNGGVNFFLNGNGLRAILLLLPCNNYCVLFCFYYFHHCLCFILSPPAGPERDVFGYSAERHHLPPGAADLELPQPAPALGTVSECACANDPRPQLRVICRYGISADHIPVTKHALIAVPFRARLFKALHVTSLSHHLFLLRLQVGGLHGGNFPVSRHKSRGCGRQ